MLHFVLTFLRGSSGYGGCSISETLLSLFAVKKKNWDEQNSNLRL